MPRDRANPSRPSLLQALLLLPACYSYYSQNCRQRRRPRHRTLTQLFWGEALDLIARAPAMSQAVAQVPFLVVVMAAVVGMALVLVLVLVMVMVLVGASRGQGKMKKVCWAKEEEVCV